jgi:(p)ppGpp synthase/HD superfamily hydrolase
MTDTSGYRNFARTFDNMLERAIYLAIMGHTEQVDKQGQPYLLHVFRVMLKGQTEEEKIVGVLHDLLEDTFFTLQDLINLDFSPEVCAAVYALTHREDQTNAQYYEQVKKYPLALRVKMNDMQDNMSRLGDIEDEKTRLRLIQKYGRGWEVLTQEEVM